MKVEEIAEIERLPLAVEYRRIYRGTARISIGDRTSAGCRIEFALELSPWGRNEISVSFLESADYPILPAVKILKEHITELDSAGALP